MCTSRNYTLKKFNIVKEKTRTRLWNQKSINLTSEQQKKVKFKSRVYPGWRIDVAIIVGFCCRTVTAPEKINH